ncbi:DUF3387 domain-containing protein [Romboutsia sedimentorum]|uniref:DUF3387 domain-containing protein n=1 Tax=Romboutsia sedimentorum TaxID=1368474 RepID=A0ABT7E6D6_9FIRM|nr:type I restriction enzyme endonuclease domain-containing protein [Romboutsia sedimentorum]MDK2562237.1 DUF3387 domain-containing protein [Romboutsia sedimentorum]
MFQKSLNKYKNQAITNAEVIEELIKMANEIRDARAFENDLGLSYDEIAALEKNKKGIKDKSLIKIADDYIKGVKIQIELNKTQDTDLMIKYEEESDKLRKPALIAMVDDYGVKVKDAHQQNYKDFKEQATVINKSNEV